MLTLQNVKFEMSEYSNTTTNVTILISMQVHNILLHFLLYKNHESNLIFIHSANDNFLSYIFH